MCWLKLLSGAPTIPLCQKNPKKQKQDIGVVSIFSQISQKNRNLSKMIHKDLKRAGRIQTLVAEYYVPLLYNSLHELGGNICITYKNVCICRSLSRLIMKMTVSAVGPLRHLAQHAKVLASPHGCFLCPLPSFSG